jgi:predicted transcriptional regulator
VPQSKDFVSIRLDPELKAELQKAADLERRSLSNFGRLLLEYAWAMYLEAGSMRELIARRERAIHRSSK